MSDWLQQFSLGNAAILGNVCLLPLYPGLFALLATRTEHEDTRGLRWMGVLVLAGVLTVMVGLAFVLHLLNAVFADILQWFLPIAFGLVIVLGILMLLDRNPLERIGSRDVPILGSPAAGAYVYGLALGPMTLPCTGPVILAAFVIGGVSGTGALVDGVVDFLFFGLGFGWPLILLPLLAGPAQRRFTGFLTRNHRVITVASGLLLIGVAIWGLLVEWAWA